MVQQMTGYEGNRDKAIEMLKNFCNRELPKHMQPTEIHIMQVMPLTPSGKIDYRVLEITAAKGEKSCIL